MIYGILNKKLFNPTTGRFKSIRYFDSIYLKKRNQWWIKKKIGRFIAERRKEKKLTQEQLSEKLNITSKAVCKWETGRNLPDASLMLDLSHILDITVNELLSGERVTKEKMLDKADENLIKLSQTKEASINKPLKN